MEEWKVIQDFPDYEVSTLGHIKSSNCLLKPYESKRGYLVVSLYKNKKQYRKTIHRLVAQAFIDNLLNEECVDHINRNRLDNRIENLRWVNKKQNGINRQRGIHNELYIYPFKDRYRCVVPDKEKRISRVFYTLEEAIIWRDSMLNINFTTINSTF